MADRSQICLPAVEQPPDSRDAKTYTAEPSRRKETTGMSGTPRGARGIVACHKCSAASNTPNPQNTENFETLLMELNSPSSAASDAESVVTLSKFSETREALDSLKRTFIDEVRQAVAVDINDLVEKAIDKRFSERSRTPLANRPAARAIRPASLAQQPPAARSPAVDVATAGPSNAWQTVAGRRKTMSQVLRDAPDPPPQPPVNAPKTPKRRKRQKKKKSNKPFSPRVGIPTQGGRNCRNN
ncbi:hypothetical protein M8J75_011862 [Diaphorina citri]|nr:hypothetical protein M8J75_011862 [Diaphorina citri]